MADINPEDPNQLNQLKNLLTPPKTEEELQERFWNQGDIVRFNAPVYGVGRQIQGLGQICGCSTQIMPLLGRGWIVKPEKDIRSQLLFTHILLYDCWLTPANDEEFS